MTFHVRLALDDRGGFQPSARSIWIRARKLETSYAARLRRIAKHIGDIVREFPEGTLEASALISAAMERYSRLIEPWANAVGGRMVAEVAQRDEASWKYVSGEMGRALHREIKSAPTGNVMRQLMAEQVELIKSLPIDAAQRVHHQTVEGIAKGERAETIAERILETGNVTKSRADLIAQTEVARTSALLTQARAQHIGCTHYVWRTVKDSHVRADHKRLEGKSFAWSEPPIADERTGIRANPGCIWRCRCYAEPIIPD